MSMSQSSPYRLPASGPTVLLDFVDLLWPEQALPSRELLPGWHVGLVDSYGKVKISGICSDSRQVKAGDLFFALPGLQVDGMQFVEQAISNGAAAVFCQADSELDSPVFDRVGKCPLIRVNQLTKQLSSIAAFFYGWPSKKMSVIGVTGTNGKTSIACMLASVTAEMEGRSGLMGTLGYGVIDPRDSASGPEENMCAASDTSAIADFDQLMNTGYTTPDAIATQAFLAELLGKGCKSTVMEVSSHALALHRVEAVEFSIAVLSNISRDHLDFHETMAAYAAAKRRLFEFDALRHAVINLDDSYAKKFLPEFAEGLKVLTYSLGNCAASLYAKNICYSENGISATICFEGQEVAFSSCLMGEFNLQNCLAVIGVLLVRGFALGDILQHLSLARAIPGRMQKVDVSFPDEHKATTPDVTVIIDYAHTPEALRVVLHALRLHSNESLVCVFGCGGDRDIGKRPLMGEIAESCADKLYLTSDNPRNEDPELIVEDICRGFKDKSRAVIELDRELAIQRAIGEARPGSLVLIAGKGHEREQIIRGQHFPFSDYQVAQRELLRRAAA